MMYINLFMWKADQNSVIILPTDAPTLNKATQSAGMLTAWLGTFIFPMASLTNMIHLSPSMDK